MRAVLPVNYLLADEILLRRETSPEGAAARQRMAALSASEKSSADCLPVAVLRYVEGQFGLAPPLSSLEDAERELQEPTSVTISLAGVVAGKDHGNLSRSALYAVESRYALYSGQRVLLSSRNGRLDATFEIWSGKDQSPEVHSVEQLPVELAVQPSSTGVALPNTLVIRQGARETIVGLQNDSTPARLFEPIRDLNFSDDDALFFRGNEITVGGKVFDAVGLTYIEHGEPYVPGRFLESGVDKGLSEKRRTLENALVAATTPAGHLIINSEEGAHGAPSAVLLPGYSNEGRGAVVSRSPTAAAALGQEDLWAVSGVSGTVNITRYSGIGNCALFQGACSDAGVLLAYRRGDGETDLVLYPHASAGDDAKGANRPEVSPILYGRIPINRLSLMGLAINETGYIAAAERQTDKTISLYLFAPMTEQTPQEAGARGEFDAQQEQGAGKITPALNDVYQRTWSPFGDGAFEKNVLEDLLFRLPIDRDSVARIRTLLQSNTSLPLERVEKHLGKGTANAGLVWSVLNRSPSRFIEVELERGANVNLRLPMSGLTPLILSCLGETTTDDVTVLLANGADVNLCDDWGRSPLYYACFRDDGGRCAEILLAAGGDPALFGTYRNTRIGCLAPALFPRDGAKNYPREIIRKLIARGARFEHHGNTTGQTCLISASARGEPEFVEQAIDAGNDVHHSGDDGFTALAAAAYFGHVQAIRVLVSNQGDPNRSGDGFSPLYHAVRRGHLAATEALLKLGADPNAGDPPPDYPLTAKGIEPGVRPEIAKAIATALLDAGLDHDRTNQPPLLRIADTEKLCPEQHAFLKALRDRGEPVSFLNTLRALQGYFVLGEGLAELLSLPNLDINSCDDRGATALHYAVSLPGKGDGVTPWQMLLKLGADPMRSSKSGNLPIHIAAATGEIAAVNALADPAPESLAHRNADGLTPLDIANAKGHEELASNLSTRHRVIVRSAEPGDATPKPPTEREFSYLQHLAWPKIWLEEKLAEAVPRVTLEFDRSDMSFKHVGRWTPVHRRSSQLPYSSVVRLVETWFRRSDHSIGVAAKVCDRGGRVLFEVDGKSPQIHQFNSSNKLRLKDEEDARTYLSFFCNAVHGDAGPFKIITKVEDIASDSALPTSLRRDIHKSLENDAIFSEANNTWWARQTLLYSHSIFESAFRIQSSGMVEMLEDKPIVTDLPTYDFACIDGLSYLKAIET
ncbi:MAG: ankyrin repeat domain-containing protein [Pseudomonadota bacterium]